MKRNLFKKAAACALSLVMTFGLAACGGEEAAELSTKDILTAAIENLESAESMSYDMAMNMSFVADDQTIEMNMTGVADYIASPLKMKMDMAMDMGVHGTYNTQMYALQENDQLISYSGLDVGTGDIIWSATALDGADELMQYDAQASLEMYVSCAENFTANGEFDVNGSKATRYDGIVTREAMNEVLEGSGILDRTVALGVSEEDLTTMLDGLGDLPISIYVDNEKNMPVKYELDMTEIMQTMMTNALSASGEDETLLNIEKVTMSMTLYNFNNVEDFEIPAEALEAEVLQL